MEGLFFKHGTIAIYATGDLCCCTLGARTQCFNGRIETYNPVLRTVVELFEAFVDIRFFSCAAEYARPLHQSGLGFDLLLEELA